MKRYKIESPEQMKEAVTIMKDSQGIWNAHNVATAWSVYQRKGIQNAFTVFVEIDVYPGGSQSAALFRQQGDTVIFLGHMYITKAKKFVKGLQEVTI